MTGLFAEDAFAGKAVLVTGATSGIGARTAREFAAHGAGVVVSGRDGERGGAVVADILEAGGRAELVIGDITDAGFCDRLVAETVERLGRLDVLFNNAGIIHDGLIDAMSDEDWRALIDTNVSGSFYMARAAVRAMKRQGGGAIINMASDAGLVGVPNAAAYSATKGAIVQLTKGMALDYAREGIRVNAVCPGETDTPMMNFVWRAEASSPAAVREKAKEYVPTGRVAEPVDVARAVMYLASEAGRHITGSMLSIDGGTSAR